VVRGAGLAFLRVWLAAGPRPGGSWFPGGSAACDAAADGEEAGASASWALTSSHQRVASAAGLKALDLVVRKSPRRGAGVSKRWRCQRSSAVRAIEPTRSGRRPRKLDAGVSGVVYQTLRSRTRSVSACGAGVQGAAGGFLSCQASAGICRQRGAAARTKQHDRSTRPARLCQDGGVSSDGSTGIGGVGGGILALARRRSLGNRSAEVRRVATGQRPAVVRADRIALREGMWRSAGGRKEKPGRAAGLLGELC